MEDCKNIMVYVEIQEGSPVKVGLEMLSPAKELADAKEGKVIAVVVGSNVKDAADKVAAAGADQVIIVDAPAYEKFNLDAYAGVMV